MTHPDFSRAIVEEGKILGYLLSAEHPMGRSKARFFAQVGFSAADWTVLADALRAHAKQSRIAATVISPYGVKYTIDGSIATPNGRQPGVRSVWIAEPNDSAPRLVTAHPL